MTQIRKDIRYLNKDFDQYRSNLVEFAKTYFPNVYNDFNESSPGSIFIELAAYVGDVLSYYTDNQLKESLMSYTNTRANVISLASSNFGYKVKNNIPATVDLDVYQLLPAKTVGGAKVPDWDYALQIRENMTINNTFRTVSSINFAQSSSFDPTEISIYQVNSVDNTPEFYLLKKKVKAIAGTLQTQTYTFNAAKRFDKILIPVTNIIEIVSVTDSDGNTWYEVPYLAQDTIFETVSNVVQNDPDLYTYDSVPYLLKIKKTARRFVTRYRSDNTLELQFGPGVSVDDDEEIIPNPDNVGSSLTGLQTQFDRPIDPSNFMYTKTYGLAPANTTLTVTYTVGGGVTSNVPAKSLTQISQIEYVTANQNLNTALLNRVRASVACTNPNPASGGKNQETIEEIRQNAIANFAAQNRAVTAQDYIIRAYSLPTKFGSVAKAYVMQDQQISPEDPSKMIANPLAINLYTLGYNNNNNLTPLNAAVKENLRTDLTQYRMLTDAINIMNAFIINIGIRFEITVLPEYNSNEVLLRCVSRLRNIFDINRWQINQPILLSRMYTELDRIEGVQSVPNIRVVNLYDDTLGYSGNVYDIGAATRDGTIYPSLDPSIFEVKFPDSDIVGKVVAL